MSARRPAWIATRSTLPARAVVDPRDVGDLLTRWVSPWWTLATWLPDGSRALRAA